MGRGGAFCCRIFGWRCMLGCREIDTCTIHVSKPIPQGLRISQEQQAKARQNSWNKKYIQHLRPRSRVRSVNSVHQSAQDPLKMCSARHYQFFDRNFIFLQSRIGTNEPCRSGKQ